MGRTAKTLAHRLAKHLVSARRPRAHRDYWIAALVRAGSEPRIELHRAVPTSMAPAAEAVAIAALRALGADLTNLTIGGDGVVGHVHSEETRARLRAAHSGRTLPEEQRTKIGEGNRRAWAEGRRTALTPKHLWTEEVRAKISAAQRGRDVPESRRAKIAASLRGRIQSIETRARRSASLRGSRNAAGQLWTAERRARHGAIARATWTRIKAAQRG